MTAQHTISRLVKYVTTGGLVNVALYFIYILLSTFFKLSPVTSTTIVYLLGIALTYIGNTYWSFKTSDHDSLSQAPPINHQILKYVTSYGVGYLVQVTSLWTIVRLTLIPHQIAQLFAMGCAAGLIFILLNKWVYALSKNKQSNIRLVTMLQKTFKNKNLFLWIVFSIFLFVPLLSQFQSMGQGGLAYHDHQKYVAISRDFGSWTEAFKRQHEKAADIILSHNERGYIVSNDRMEAEKTKKIVSLDKEFAKAGDLYHVFWRRGAVYTNILITSVSSLFSSLIDPIYSYQFISIFLGSISITAVLSIAIEKKHRIISLSTFGIVIGCLVLSTSPSYLYILINPMGELAFILGGGLGSALFIAAADYPSSNKVGKALLASLASVLLFLAYTARLDAALIFPGICTLYLIARSWQFSPYGSNFSDMWKQNLPIDTIATVAAGMIILYLSEVFFYGYLITPIGFHETVGLFARLTWPFYTEMEQNHALTIALFGWTPLCLFLMLRLKHNAFAWLIALISFWPILLILTSLERNIWREVRYFVSTLFPILVGFALASRLQFQIPLTKRIKENYK